MNQALLPRTLRRVANILDTEADAIGRSYALIQVDGRTTTSAEREQTPTFTDATARREFKEYRRLAKQLREAAG